ncbi:MAG: type I 3-dehydroquinate dehydratase [Candidatus Aminicenantales bacterium]
MICVSLGISDFSECRRILKNLDWAEIRLDQARFSREQVRKIFALPKNLIATCRPGSHSEAERKQYLLDAVHAGARYVDLEIESLPAFKSAIIKDARLKGCRIILSYHNFQNTPSERVLAGKVRKCFRSGADIAKIVCKVNSNFDTVKILSLYGNEYAKQGKILALGLGKKGKITRVAAVLLGAPFTFASLKKGYETAEGQMDKRSLEKIWTLLQERRK